MCCARILSADRRYRLSALVRLRKMEMLITIYQTYMCTLHASLFYLFFFVLVVLRLLVHSVSLAPDRGYVLPVIRFDKATAITDFPVSTLNAKIIHYDLMIQLNCYYSKGQIGLPPLIFLAV